MPRVEPVPDVRVERIRDGFAIVTNEEPMIKATITERQAQQILNGLWKFGVRPGG